MSRSKLLAVQLLRLGAWLYTLVLRRSVAAERAQGEQAEARAKRTEAFIADLTAQVEAVIAAAETCPPAEGPA